MQTETTIGNKQPGGASFQSRVIRFSKPTRPMPVFFYLLILVPSLSGSAIAGRNAAHVTLHLDSWDAAISPESLKIVATTGPSGNEFLIADGGGKRFGVLNLSQSPDSVQWEIPALGMKVKFSREQNHLHGRFSSALPQRFVWPFTGLAPEMSAVIYPEGEGLYLPIADPFWLGRMAGGHCRDLHGGLSMPFWSYQLNGGTITYLVESDLRTEVCFDTSHERLSTYAVHDFLARDGLGPYEIDLWLGGASPISPGIEYQDWLTRRREFVTLDQKQAENPNVSKLLGAIHAYVFGDGRTLPFLKELEELGIDRIWLGFEQNSNNPKYRMDNRYIAEAERQGFLVGPYDEFCNVQNPRSADDPTSVWDESLWRNGCISQADGRPKTGFAGRGCELSSEALAEAEPREHYMARRIEANVQRGINSYFLDDDAFGELFDDYSYVHSMTMEQDRANRLRRLEYLSRSRKLVLGSENGVGWSVPAIAFAQGMETVSSDLLWALQKDKKTYGGWWPQERPGIFFKHVDASRELATAGYNPVYRIPLFQSVFHSSMITTDRWEVPLTKFPRLERTRMLLELLYDVPSIWSLDLQELRTDSETITKLYSFFSPIHRRAGGQALTEFEWLTANRKVQRTHFANGLELTANFDDASFGTLRPMCIEARWTGDRIGQVFCPGR